MEVKNLRPNLFFKLLNRKIYFNAGSCFSVMGGNINVFKLIADIEYREKQKHLDGWLYYLHLKDSGVLSFSDDIEKQIKKAIVYQFHPVNIDEIKEG